VSLERLAERCRAAGMVAQIEDLRLREDGVGVRQALIINVPAARGTRRVHIVNDPERQDELDAIVDSDIPVCRFIDGYDAIWSEAGQFVEARLTFGGLGGSLTFLYGLRRIVGAVNVEDHAHGAPILTVVSPDNARTLSIRTASLEHDVMVRGRVVYRSFVVRIDGLAISTHDSAKNALESIANSFLFQLDRVTGVPAYLAPERIRFRQFGGRETGNPTFPRFSYDVDAMALYWHARSADTNRLSFLGYYQVLEYYFPVHATAYAQHQLQAILKDPLFDPSNDADIARVLDVAKRLAGKGGAGDESSQLEATVRACVDEEALREFIGAREERAGFLAKPSVLVEFKINIGNEKKDAKVDLLGDVSRRLYGIRNAIVHSKHEETRERILPFSVEDARLTHDVDLIRHIAIRVLNRGSRTLT